MAAEKSCACQIKGHGHEPGKCPNEATQANDLCEHCHAKAQELLGRQKSFPDESFFTLTEIAPRHVRQELAAGARRLDC